VKRELDLAAESCPQRVRSLPEQLNRKPPIHLRAGGCGRSLPERDRNARRGNARIHVQDESGISLLPS
jgi:hypothetical protein